MGTFVEVSENLSCYSVGRSQSLVFAGQDLSRKPLQAVGAQGCDDLVRHRGLEHACATEVTTTLLRPTGGQVTRPSSAVLDLPAGREAESLLGTLMGLHLGHDNNSLAGVPKRNARPSVPLLLMRTAHAASARTSGVSEIRKPRIVDFPPPTQKGEQGRKGAGCKGLGSRGEGRGSRDRRNYFTQQYLRLAYYSYCRLPNTSLDSRNSFNKRDLRYGIK